MTELAHGGSTRKMDQGTYKAVERVAWTTLLDHQFGIPDWAGMYPISPKTGLPVGLLPPRMACKLFHDALEIIKRGETNSKYIQDRIPQTAIKQFKKKQWRKQFFECMRRVTCRLAAGLGFRPNCVGEDIFVHMILNLSLELGWRRIAEHIDPLPETERDKDWGKCSRLANEEIGSLIKGTTETESTKTKKMDPSRLDVKSWFKCYENNADHVFDHIIRMDETEDMEGWSVASSSTSLSDSILCTATSAVATAVSPIRTISSPITLGGVRSGGGYGGGGIDGGEGGGGEEISSSISTTSPLLVPVPAANKCATKQILKKQTSNQNSNENVSINVTSNQLSDLGL